jgi:hypothetical protein
LDHAEGERIVSEEGFGGAQAVEGQFLDGHAVNDDDPGVKA